MGYGLWLFTSCHVSEGLSSTLVATVTVSEDWAYGHYQLFARNNPGCRLWTYMVYDFIQ